MKEVTGIQQGLPTLIYILAASHSGSTLTAMLLNAHPGICTVGELKASHLGDVDQYRCSCQEFIGQCEFWRRVSADMHERGLDFDVRNARTSLRSIPGKYVQRILRPLHRGQFLEWIRDSMLSLSFRWRRYYPVWQARNRELIASVARIANVECVADSSKVATRLKYLLRIPQLNVKVIRLVRDGRAVSLTYIDPARFADASDRSLRGGGSGTRRNDAISMAEAAWQWRRSNEEAEELIKTLGTDDWIQIKYEDLCMNTLETMTAVHEFLGVKKDQSFERFRTAVHHVVGNGMRLDSGDEVVLDERWKQTLTAAQLDEFDTVAGELNHSYGYQ